MSQNIAVIGIKYFFVDLIGGVVKFPLWWYTRGLKQTAAFCFGSIRNRWQGLGLGVWLKNLFVPMYGDTSFGGRIISFFMRGVVILGKGLLFILWSLLMLVVMVLYLVVLPGAILFIIYNLIFDQNQFYLL